MVRIVLRLVLVTNDVRRHHFHKQKTELLKIFSLIQPLFPLGNNYFHQNNLDLHVEIIHCIQAISRHWSREPITTLSRPSVFYVKVFQTADHAGQIFIPHRHNDVGARLYRDKTVRSKTSRSKIYRRRASPPPRRRFFGTGGGSTPVWYENLSGVVSCPENSNINTDGLDSVVI